MSGSGPEPRSEGPRIRPAVWLLAAAAILAAVYFPLRPQRGGDVERRTLANEPARDVRPDDAADRRDSVRGRHEPATPLGAATESARERTLRELDAASESFRNSTFLVAIHETGHVCEVVSDAIAIGDPVDGWHVECPEALAYAVSVDLSGELTVAPAPWSMDAQPLAAPGIPSELR